MTAIPTIFHVPLPRQGRTMMRDYQRAILRHVIRSLERMTGPERELHLMQAAVYQRETDVWPRVRY